MNTESQLSSQGATALLRLIPSPSQRPREYPLLERGVCQVPWLGPNGRAVFASITSDRRKLEEIELPLGTSAVELERDMLARLDAADAHAARHLTLER